jgi:cyclin-dependent kinase 5 activator 1
MGTVLSFNSPRERRPIYTTSHHGSGTISTSNSTSDFQLNNYAYEQINNVKNRENVKPMQYLSVPNQFQLQNGNNANNLMLFGSSNSNIVNNNLTNNGGNASIVHDQSDSARILSEKNAIEKNMKKHSLFINALSWKRLSSSHGKKKIESNNAKNKNGSITTSSFRPPTLTDTVHPMVVVNDKKKYPQQQVQLIASNNNSNQIVTTNQTTSSNNYFTQDHKNLIALDLQNANLHNQYPNIDKIIPKMSIPVRPVQFSSSSSTQQQQQSSANEQQTSSAAPRKTIIQVSHDFCFN